MKFAIVNGIKYLTDAKGVFFKDAEGEKVEVTDEQAATLEETTTPTEAAPVATDADAKIDNESVEELKSFISKLAGKEAKDAVKALNLVDGFSAVSRKAFAEALADKMEVKSSLDLTKIKFIHSF